MMFSYHEKKKNQFFPLRNIFFAVSDHFVFFVQCLGGMLLLYDFEIYVVIKQLWSRLKFIQNKSQVRGQ